jgi:hypothetical protein
MIKNDSANYASRNLVISIAIFISFTRSFYFASFKFDNFLFVVDIDVQVVRVVRGWLCVLFVGRRVCVHFERGFYVHFVGRLLRNFGCDSLFLEVVVTHVQISTLARLHVEKNITVSVEGGIGVIRVVVGVIVRRIFEIRTVTFLRVFELNSFFFAKSLAVLFALAL